MPSLKERFEAFVPTLEGFESIDYLLMGNDYAGKQRADYLLNGRTIIIEQKSLEQNPTDKPQKFVERLANEQRLPDIRPSLNQSDFRQNGRDENCWRTRVALGC